MLLNPKMIKQAYNKILLGFSVKIYIKPKSPKSKNYNFYTIRKPKN